MANNTAIVAKLSNIRPIEGADKIKLADVTVNGVKQAQVVVGLDSVEGQRVVYFTSNMCLNESTILKAYEDLGRYLGRAGRVRTIKLKGVISDGLAVEVEKFIQWAPLGTFVEGFEFTDLGAWNICKRYEPPVRHIPQPKGDKKSKKLKKFNRLVEDQVRLHYDTDNLRRNAHKFNLDDIVSISRKMHGCVSHNTRISMADGSFKRVQDIVVGDRVLGFDETTKEIVETSVDNIFDNGTTSTWLRLKLKGKDALVVTPNHEVFTKRGFVPAGELVAGQETIYLKKEGYSINNTVRQALLGKLLGDGSIGGNGGELRVDFSHKMVHKEYSLYCRTLLGDLCSSSEDTRTSGFGTTMFRSKTKQDVSIAKMFDPYIKGRKFTIVEDIVNDLSPLTIALWYLDDGSLAHNKTQYQRDRAAIAVCSFNEQQVMWLVKGLERLGIIAVPYCRKAYETSKEYWRLRINADSAEVMFKMIREFVPPCMQYKLPEEHRGFFKEPVSPILSRVYYTNEYLLDKIERIERSVTSQGAKRYDFSTGTHNYIANDTLVHNSSGTTQHVQTKRILTLKEKIAKFFGVPVVETEYDYIYTSRTVVKNANINLGEQKHFYGFDLWTDVGAKTFKGKLAKGESAYYEIVGYLPSGGAIQKGYGYGCKPNECKVYLYRMTMTNPDGEVREYTWPQLLERAKELEVDVVETYYYGSIRQLTKFMDESYEPAMLVDWLEAKYLGKKAPDCNNNPDEGIVVRKEGLRQAEAYKLKDGAFINRESDAFNKGEEDIEEGA